MRTCRGGVPEARSGLRRDTSPARAVDELSPMPSKTQGTRLFPGCFLGKGVQCLPEIHFLN